MKKTIIYLTALAAFALAAGNVQAQTQSLEQRVAELEARLKAIERLPGVQLMLNGNPNIPEQTVQAKPPLALFNWDYQFKPGQYQWENKHWFSYPLKNQSGKAIKLIDCSLQFTDL